MTKERSTNTAAPAELKNGAANVKENSRQDYIRRLLSKPRLATPWKGDFTMDVPLEVFEVTLITLHHSK